MANPISSLVSKTIKSFIKKSRKKKKTRAQESAPEGFDDSNLYNIEYKLKSRGMTPAQKKQLRKEMAITGDPYPPKSKKPKSKKLKPAFGRGKEPPKARTSKSKKPKSNDAAAKQFMPDKPAAGMGTNKRQPKSKIMKLQQEYEALRPSAKRAERAKGKLSRFSPVFEKLGMIGRAKGGSLMKKRHGGMTHVGLSPAEEARAGTMPQVKRRRYMKKGGTVSRAYGGSTKGSKPISTTGSYKGKKQLASWQSGLSADAIKKILGITTRDPETGIQSKLKTPAKKKKVVKARKGGQVKRISHKQLDGSQLVGSTYD
tara:strand:+ start:140 stop:1081 length:942 start_codon:yes stop_codon:yes gene_type:complete